MLDNKSVREVCFNDARLKFGDYHPTNVEKSRPLELAVKLALHSLKISFEDLTHIYNGTQMSRHQGLICGFVPDFMTSKCVIECKHGTILIGLVELWQTLRLSKG